MRAENYLCGIQKGKDFYSDRVLLCPFLEGMYVMVRVYMERGSRTRRGRNRGQPDRAHHYSTTPKTPKTVKRNSRAQPRLERGASCTCDLTQSKLLVISEQSVGQANLSELTIIPLFVVSEVERNGQVDQTNLDHWAAFRDEGTKFVVHLAEFLGMSCGVICRFVDFGTA